MGPDLIDGLKDLLLRVVAVSNPMIDGETGLSEPRSQVQELLAVEVHSRIAAFLRRAGPRRDRGRLRRVQPNCLAAFCLDHSQDRNLKPSLAFPGRRGKKVSQPPGLRSTSRQVAAIEGPNQRLARMASQAENRQVERNPGEGLLEVSAKRLLDVDAVAGHVGKVHPTPHCKQHAKKLR